jgi:hypothetical protein
MTHKDDQPITVQLSPEAVQIGLAYGLAEQLNISGWDEIDVDDILDCMAVAGCHLEIGGESARKAYFASLKITEITG